MVGELVLLPQPTRVPKGVTCSIRRMSVPMALPSGQRSPYLGKLLDALRADLDLFSVCNRPYAGNFDRGHNLDGSF